METSRLAQPEMFTTVCHLSLHLPCPQQLATHPCTYHAHNSLPLFPAPTMPTTACHSSLHLPCSQQLATRPCTYHAHNSLPLILAPTMPTTACHLSLHLPCSQQLATCPCTYHAHNSLPLVPAPSRLDSVQALPSCSFFFLLSVGLPVANAPGLLQPCGLLYHP